VAKLILDKHKDPVAIYKVKYLLAKALEQQEKADTSERLGSDPKACMSSAHKEIPAAKPDPKDLHWQTGTIECQRIDARNWKDPSYPNFLWFHQGQREDPKVSWS
jgi:hypothetical protein